MRRVHKPGFDEEARQKVFARRSIIDVRDQHAVARRLLVAHRRARELCAQCTSVSRAFRFIVGQVTTPTVVTLSATLNGVTASSQFTLRPPTLNDETLQPQVKATGGASMAAKVGAVAALASA